MTTLTATTWGWFVDPYEVHEYRYFSEGLPTKLVRDSGQESFDPPPDLPVPHAAVAADGHAHAQADGADMRRADDAERAAPYSRRAARDKATAAIFHFGSAG